MPTSRTWIVWPWRSAITESRRPSALLVLILLGALACTPALYTRTNPPGLAVSGEILQYGEPVTDLVTLSIKRPKADPSWQAEFTDGSTESIHAEDIPGLTILKWKVDPERRKTLTKRPYLLRIHSGAVSYEATVSFNSAGRDFSGRLLLDIAVRLIIGH